MAIRYDKKLNTEINRVIKNFNQKIARLEKQQHDLLPNKITKKELKSTTYSRVELRRKLKELERFSKRGAEDVITTSSGVRTTKYELEQLKRDKARLKRNIAREIKRLETSTPTISGKKQVATFAQMGDQFYLNLKARYKALDKEVDTLSKEVFAKYKSLIDRTKNYNEYMDLQFKENYYTMLTDLGYFVGYDDKKLDLLKIKLLKLPKDTFIKMFKNDKSIQAILYYYPIYTGKVKGMNPEDIKDDVTALYDDLIDNIDDIINEYS